MKNLIELKNRARNLRTQGYSLARICDIINHKKSSVYHWIKDIDVLDIKKRKFKNPKETLYIKEYKKKCLDQRLKWQEDGKTKAKENDVFHAFVCALYWGEGTKKRGYASLINLDCNLILQWVIFIKKYFPELTNRIKVNCSYYIGSGLTDDEIKLYWSNRLDVPKNNIKTNGKIRPNHSDKYYRNKYGICSVSVSSTKLVQHIFGAIQQYANFNNDTWINKI